MSRHIRLLYSRGKELPKGEPEVDDNVQKIRTRGNVRASVYSVEVDIAGEAKCRVRLDTEVRVVVASSIEDHMRLDRIVIFFKLLGLSSDSTQLRVASRRKRRIAKRGCRRYRSDDNKMERSCGESGWVTMRRNGCAADITITQHQLMIPVLCC